jgi:hypothetical protein
MRAQDMLLVLNGFSQLGRARRARYALGAFAALAAGCGLLEPVDPCLRADCVVDAGHSATTATTTAPPADGAAPSGSVAASTGSAPLASAAPDSGPDSGPDASGADASDGSAADGSAVDGGPACVMTCDGVTPLCDVTTGECVVCLGDTDCAAGVCDPAQHACVACFVGEDAAVDPGCGGLAPRCAVNPGPGSDADAGAAAQCVACLGDADCGGGTPLCDVSVHACVGCLTSDDCVDPAAARCDADTRSCAACLAEQHDTAGANPDCAHLGGSDVCAAGSCVECTGEFAGACGEQVCDELPGATKFTCSQELAGSASACGACVSDAQCDPGLNCVETTFGSGASQEAVGYFCLYRVDAGLVGNDAAIISARDEAGVRACSSQAQPYVSSVTATSLSGWSGAFCSPSAATCVALNQYRATACEPPGAGDAGVPDESVVAECGEPGLNDAVCQQWDELWRCSPRCVGDEDCPSGTCVAGANPRYCSF